MNKKKQSSSSHRSEQICGRFFASSGMAFFQPDDAGSDELDVPQEWIRDHLVDGDYIRVSLTRRSESGLRADRPVPEIEYIEVLERDREVVGVIDQDGQLEPLHEVGASLIQLRDGSCYDDGSVALVKLNKPHPKAQRVCGEVVEILDDKTDTNLESEIVLRAFNVPCTWSDEVVAEAERSTKRPVSRHVSDREDLRDVDFVTIDGEDAKDFDDAVFCRKTSRGWHISIAVADVAFYVRPDSALDRVASERGNSVYLPGRVVPMLPLSLSSDACSLLPDADRLALVCHCVLSRKGELESFKFVRAVIRSKARLTYREVGGLLSGRSRLEGRPAGVKAMLKEAYRACRQLLAQRQRRGALDFDTLETRLTFDKHGDVRGIIPVLRNEAHRLIEEFMIAANVCAARFLREHDEAFLYRSHGGLKKESIDTLKDFINGRGLTWRGERARDLAALLQAARERDDHQAIQSMVLRSLSAALYEPEAGGHFGLALDEYTHFTSPIRRYPDLLVHRTIHRVLGSDSGALYREKALRIEGRHCSFTEKRADSATHDFEKYLKCIYAQDYVGDTFTGTITAVTSFGLFILISDLYVEGLLHVKALKSDYYLFDSSAHCLVGERSGRTYHLGDQLDVTLASVRPEARRISLALPGSGTTTRSGSRGR